MRALPGAGPQPRLLMAVLAVFIISAAVSGWSVSRNFEGGLTHEFCQYSEIGRNIRAGEGLRSRMIYSSALATLDERGIPFVLTLLDRQWLKQQPYDPRATQLGLMDEASLRKIIASTINVVVGFDPRLGGFTVRVKSPQVWEMIKTLAQSDPDAEIRALATAALTAREARADQ